jgi:hypothetical protein
MTAVALQGVIEAGAAPSAALAVNLRREGLVVAHHKSRATILCDDVSHRKRLAGTGGTEKRL